MIFCTDSSYKNILKETGLKLILTYDKEYYGVKCWVFEENDKKFNISELDKVKTFVSDKMYF